MSYEDMRAAAEAAKAYRAAHPPIYASTTIAEKLTLRDLERAAIDAAAAYRATRR
jgi:hypothetical protein